MILVFRCDQQGWARLGGGKRVEKHASGSMARKYPIAAPATVCKGAAMLHPTLQSASLAETFDALKHEQSNLMSTIESP
jgi:hypothetical protein